MFAFMLLDTFASFGVLGKGNPRKRNILTYGMQYNQDIWFQIVLILKWMFGREGNILLLSLVVFIYMPSTELISIMSTHDIGN